MAKTIVPDIVHDQALTHLARTTTVREAAKAMAARRIGAVMISTADGTLEGIFTERDLVSRVIAQGRDPDAVTLAEVMTVAPDTLAPNDAPLAALERMQSRGYRHLPVVDKGKVVGMVSIRDLYAAVHAVLKEDIKHKDAMIFGENYGQG